MSRDAYIFDTVRTPRGKGREGGGLSEVTPIALLEGLYDALAERQNFPLERVDDVLLGCVTQTDEQGADLARISVLYADWPVSVSGMTLNRFCASGLDAVNLGAAKVATGMEDLVVAGGVESISRVPMFSDEGPWFADPEVARKTRFVQMGFAADVVASRAGLDRDTLDAYAVESHQRAARAFEKGRFDQTLVAVTDGDGQVVLDRDELIRPETSVEKIADFAPAFADQTSEAFAAEVYPDLELEHVHHRANSPSLADGAALSLVGNETCVEELGLKPRARIRSWANASMEPVAMLTACETAAERALQNAGMTAADIDLWEVNEAFAAVPVKLQRDFDIDPDRFNVNGGTIAMGHAMGATGTMLLANLVDELKRRDLQTGLVTISGGAGLGSAAVVELG
ncbi:MAG: acetyl-CoA C-acyltransferase [Persicimonas sp.]